MESSVSAEETGSERVLARMISARHRAPLVDYKKPRTAKAGGGFGDFEAALPWPMGGREVGGIGLVWHDVLEEPR
jgi:hypothetical protein